MTQPNPEAREAARRFLEDEGDFRLGVLPTEQPHPKTVGLAETSQADTAAAVRMILSVDRDIPPVAEAALGSPEFARLEDAVARAVGEGRTVYLSGCGATGRVSLLLEAAWRRYWRDKTPPRPGIENALHGMITGGDYALVRSVEGFEDYVSFGRRQIADAGVGAGDVVIAISEGGETSAVIGTAWQGLDVGAEVFFVCNNPADVLIEHVPRSREILSDARVAHIDLASGPMAVAGSTRMQATTSEILVVGAALELALTRVPGADEAPAALEYARRFEALLDALDADATVEAVAAMAASEAETYATGGVVTYFADTYMMDIFTDTTERSPTFMTPPFRRADDALSPRPWAFVKSLRHDRDAAWREVYQRDPRCLAWTDADYREMDAAPSIRKAPPNLAREDIHQFPIGREDDPSRRAHERDLACLVVVGAEAADLAETAETFRALSRDYPRRASLVVAPEPPRAASVETRWAVCYAAPSSPLDLWNHLAVKLVLNTVSTAAMARLGRLVSNWMAHVETSNKKLVDRGARLIATLAEVSYEQACHALHQTIHELAARPSSGKEKPSPVALTIERLIRGHHT